MNKDDLNYTSDDSFSVESILAEYEAEKATASPSEEPAFQEPSATEHRGPEGPNHIVYSSREQAIGEAEFSSEGFDSQFTSDPSAEPESQADERDFVSYSPEGEPAESFPETPFSDSTGEPEPESKGDPSLSWEEEYVEAQVITDATDEGYASGGEDYAQEAQERDRDYSSREPDFKEKILAPILGLMAASAAKREQRRRTADERRKTEATQLPPELRPDRAAGFYAAQAQSLRLRCFIATALTVVLVYLSYGLPAFGLLGASPSVRSLVCLILELAVMVVGLDIITNGLFSLFRGKPGAESLIAVSCVITAVDALIIAITGKLNVGMPFCAVSALSVVLALWGGYFSCKSFAISFDAAARPAEPSLVLSLSGIDGEGCVLAKAKRPVSGFVRTAETADSFENAYRYAAPILLAACLILSLFCFIASEKCTDLIHTLAASLAACASLSAVFGFAFLFWTLAKRLAVSGVAVAGYAGAAELGRLRRVMITDTDVFPLRTLSIADISMSEGARPEVVISCTGSVIAAAGLGIAPVFTELMRKNGCVMQRVEDFACHEGGGLIARVNGDQVYVGTSSFMQLMGIRLPKGYGGSNAVFTALNGSIAGIFSVNYKPVATVQRALVSLLRSKIDPLFAIRDFNITPMLIKQKFRLPTKSYDFPSFADRYRVSSKETEDKGMVAAMFSRGGLNAMAGLVTRGRKLYNSARAVLALSILGAVIGPILMLSLCWSGSYDSASCANLITFMLLWLLPTFIVSLGLRR